MIKSDFLIGVLILYLWGNGTEKINVCLVYIYLHYKEDHNMRWAYVSTYYCHQCYEGQRMDHDKK